MQENTMRERERERERERGLDTKKWGNTQIPLSFPPENRLWKRRPTKVFFNSGV
jgi:hypothetical protein